MIEHTLTPEDRQKMNEATERGIQEGLDHAHEQWKRMAIGVLYEVAQTRETFTVNDVRAIVKLSTLRTHDNRAMGGVMQHGKKEKWIEPTGQSIPSVVGHRVHIQVWRSNIYQHRGESVT